MKGHISPLITEAVFGKYNLPQLFATFEIQSTQRSICAFDFKSDNCKHL